MVLLVGVLPSPSTTQSHQQGKNRLSMWDIPPIMFLADRLPQLFPTVYSQVIYLLLSYPDNLQAEL